MHHDCAVFNDFTIKVVETNLFVDLLIYVWSVSGRRKNLYSQPLDQLSQQIWTDMIQTNIPETLTAAGLRLDKNVVTWSLYLMWLQNMATLPWCIVFSDHEQQLIRSDLLMFHFLWHGEVMWFDLKTRSNVCCLNCSIWSFMNRSANQNIIIDQLTSTQTILTSSRRTSPRTSSCVIRFRSWTRFL